MSAPAPPQPPPSMPVQLGPEVLTLLHVPRPQARLIWREVQLLLPDGGPQLLAGALVLADLGGVLRLRAVECTTKGEGQQGEQQQQQQQQAGSTCRLHLQGGGVVGLEQLDPRPLDQLPGQLIADALYEHAHWALAAGVAPLEAGDAMNTLHHL